MSSPESKPMAELLSGYRIPQVRRTPGERVPLEHSGCSTVQPGRKITGYDFKTSFPFPGPKMTFHNMGCGARLVVP